MGTYGNGAVMLDHVMGRDLVAWEHIYMIVGHLFFLLFAKGTLFSRVFIWDWETKTRRDTGR